MTRVCTLLPSLLLAGLVACSGGGGDDGDGTGTPDPLEIATASLTAGKVGQAFDVKIAARGGVPPYTFRHLSGSLPDGLMVKAETGQISGNPTEGGTFDFTIEVADSKAVKATKAFTLEIAVDPVLITSADLPDGDTATAYSADLEASGGVAPLMWSIASGALPRGLALSATGRVSGTPSEAGAFTVTIAVTDAAAATDSRAFTFEITDATPMITSQQLPPARAGGPYSAQLEVTGGTGPYTFSLTTGMLPNGLTLDASGLISGMPDDEGTFTFTVEVTDANDATGSLQLMILAAREFSIVTTSLPLALLNDAYDFDLEATGGIAPYRWFLANETPLPAGLTLSDQGNLSGTPTEAGDFVIRIRAHDEGGTGLRSSRQYSLRVRDLRQYSASAPAAFPPLCTTSTHVSYQVVEIDVPDSFTIADANITVDIPYTDSDANPVNSNHKLRAFLVSPSGRQVVLCGNSTGVRGGTDCGGNGGLDSTYGALGIPPEQSMDVLNGTNAQGTWLLRVAVVGPTTTGASCDQAGMIDEATLTLAADNSPDPYIIVSGFTTNNLLTYPWVRISGGGIASQQELFLAATLWDVGPNGRREAGAGDDVPDARVFTWSGTGFPTGSSITPDGHVTTGGITSRGMQPMITATDGMGSSVTMPIAITPPDWNPDVREF